MIELKTAPLLELKAGPDDDLEEGQFLAYASTFIRTPDSYGDVVKKGAFKATISEWKASGNTLPVLFGHNMQDPDYNLGGVIEAREDERGLLVKGQLDLENPKAVQVYRLLKGRRLSQLSFAFDIREDGIVTLENDVKVRELRDLKLYEVSLVPIGANQDTEVLAVKAVADGLKAGRVLSAKNIASLKSARDSLVEVILAAEPSEDTPKASPAVVASSVQEDVPAKSSSRSAQAVALATTLLSL